MSADVACPHHDVVNSADTSTEIEYKDTNTKTYKMQEVTEKHDKVRRPFSASDSVYAVKNVIIRPYSDTCVRLRDVRDPESSDFEGKLFKLRTNIVNNWIFIKENSSPFSWWKQFKEKFFSKSDSKERDIESMKIERRDLAELLLIKVLKKGVCRNLDDIEFLESTIFGETKHILKLEEKENTQKASSDISYDDSTNLTKYRTEWEQCLNRQDLITIKDHLLQEDIITFEENEKLVKDENYYSRNKKHLFSQMLKTVELKTDKGSIQCFMKYATNIMEEKQCGQKLIQMIKGQPSEMIQPAKKSSIIKEESIKEYDIKQGQHVTLSLEMKLVDSKNSAEVTEIYSQAKDKADATEMIMAQTLGAGCVKITYGSLLITFQPLHRDMYCTSDFRFKNMIQMLLKEINLESWLASGQYTLTAKVSVNQPVNQTVHDFQPLTDSINFVDAEKSFLEDEIDTVAVLNALEKRQIKIENSDPPHDRKNIARKLLKAIIDNNLEEDLISILRKNGMMYVLNRYEAFQKVYGQETDGLRRNIIRQFSKITKNINVDDVRDILIGLRIIDKNKFDGIVQKCGNRTDIAMSTLILEFLKSGSAIHAFAYALYLQELNPLDEMVLPETQQTSDANHKNGNYHNQEGTNLLFEGSFNISISDADEEKSIDQGLVEPSNNSGMEKCNVVNASSVDINGDESFTSKHNKSTLVISEVTRTKEFSRRIFEVSQTK